jgi:hypothetical protein
LLALKQTSVDKLFRVGWNVLFHDVVLGAAKAAEAVLASAGHASSPNTTKSLARAAAALRSAVAAGKPWIALRDLACLEERLGHATFVTLSALLDECPSLLPVAGDEGSDVVFIGSDEQLQTARGLLERLLSDACD